MKILIDIGHPAHVHLFKHLARLMLAKGHHVFFTVREKEHEVYLLKTYGFEYKSFGKHYQCKIGKAWGLLKFNLQLLAASLKFKPDILVSHGSIYAAQVSWLIRKPHISLEDTGNMEQVKLYKPFTDVILTSTSFKRDLGHRQLSYNGYHELAYLHPHFFRPDESVLVKLNVAKGQPYVVMRFVSWGASHDTGHPGISMNNKIRALRKFLKYARVFISSESKLPPELEPFRFEIGPEYMHDALAFATLIYGESATMASEGAMLGVPAIYLDNTGRYYTRELEEKYRLVFNFSESLEDQERSIRKAVEILKDTTVREKWQQRRREMLAEKIDVTSWLAWFLEHYPRSIGIMKEKRRKQWQRLF
ncbi:MAG TPA: DUF354 domain-containing protein [Candidatus Deferrimicrobium sp.]|nr:DUF354 domain-containing protein [Candidatus Deferrimicrobium sp.]